MCFGIPTGGEAMKKIQMLLANLCYVIGVFASIYVGGWLMLILPIQEVLMAFDKGTLTFAMLAVNILKIALSTTFAGFVWTIGYIGYNYFRGTDDPDWSQKKDTENHEKEKS